MTIDNVLTLTYHGTHYYLLDAVEGKLLVDAGWPGSLATLAGKLKAYALTGKQVRYVLPTHMHPDHAGLVQEIKQAWGTRLLIPAVQIPFLPALAAIYAKKGGYVPIKIEARDVVLTGDGRAQLKAMGIDGEIVATPGHSDDSVSLVLDSGAAFVGDLTLPQLAGEEALATVRASWQALAGLGVQTVYPGHARSFGLEEIKSYLT